MKRQSGQALVLVLLSLAVVLTLVLFILSRSVTDILTSSKNEETSRAFSAAEAGIEQALVIGTAGANSDLGNNSGFVSSVSEYPPANSYNYNYPIELTSGDSFTTWFVSHDASGSSTLCDATHPCFTGNQVKVCWGKPNTGASTPTTPALEVSFFYESTPGSLATIKIARIAVDPHSGRVAQDSFAAPDGGGTCTLDGVTYQFAKTITLSALGIPLLGGATTSTNEMQFARIRMFYNSDATHPVGITTNLGGGSTLPSQGQNIESTGTAGQSTRKVSVFQSWPEPPSILDFAIYSPGGITK